MIVMDLALTNVLGFDDVDFNFSYKRKLKNNVFGDECLSEIPSFKYKKVNIIMGSNSSGKSSLGRIIWNLSLFLKTKESKFIKDLAQEGANTLSIKFDFVTKSSEGQKSFILNRIFLKYSKQNSDLTEEKLEMAWDYVSLRQNDTYESASKNLTDNPQMIQYLDCLKNYKHNDGWSIGMPITESGFETFDVELDKNEREEFNKVLFKVLNTLDPNIVSTLVSKEIENCYIIQFEDGKMSSVKSGDKIADVRFLSSGTKYGLRIANTFYRLLSNSCGLYYVDELFSYINSDIEMASLATMISLLGENEQLFFTTHNTDVMTLPYPLHAFQFLAKKKIDGKYRIVQVQVADFEKRNNVVIKNLYDNDTFNVAPSVKNLFNLETLRDGK